MKTRTMFVGVTCILFAGLESAVATTIYYDAANIGGSTWEYNYTVNNDTLGFNIDEFTVYFSSGTYTNLSSPSAPATWDPVLAQPDSVFSNDGWYDALALSGGILPGGSLGDFSVRFDYLGTGTPGSQFFEIVNPADFSVLDSGNTDAVPVPPSVWLFASGLIGLVGMARRKS